MNDKAQQLIADILNGVVFGATREQHVAHLRQAVSGMTHEEQVAVMHALETAIDMKDVQIDRKDMN